MINKKQKQGFTLVELIVVITILAILGTIAFIQLQGYQVDSRNSIRLTDTRNISTSLEINNINSGKYPIPSDYFEVVYDSTILSYQGNMGLDLLNRIGINGGGVDPSTEKPYTYSIDGKKTSYELLFFLEKSSYSNFNNPIINETYAVSFDDTKPLSSGKKVGVLLNTDNSVVSDISSSINLNNLNTEYKIYYNDEGDYVSGTGLILTTSLAKLNGNNSIDPSLIGYWDMDTKIKVGNEEFFEDLSKNDNHGELRGNTITTEAGIIGNGIKLINNDDFLNIDLATSTGTLDWNNGYTFSVSHKTSVTNAGNKLLFLSGAYNMGIGSSTERIYGVVYNNDSLDFTTSLVEQIADNWQINTYTYDDGTGLSSIYTNGELSKSESGQIGTPYSPNTTAMFVGRASTDTNFIGTIDEVRIYNRPLSADEVKLLNTVTN